MSRPPPSSFPFLDALPSGVFTFDAAAVTTVPLSLFVVDFFALAAGGVGGDEGRGATTIGERSALGRTSTSRQDLLLPQCEPDDRGPAGWGPTRPWTNVFRQGFVLPTSTATYLGGGGPDKDSISL